MLLVINKFSSFIICWGKDIVTVGANTSRSFTLTPAISINKITSFSYITDHTFYNMGVSPSNGVLSCVIVSASQNTSQANILYLIVGY